MAGTKAESKPGTNVDARQRMISIAAIVSAAIFAATPVARPRKLRWRTHPNKRLPGRGAGRITQAGASGLFSFPYSSIDSSARK